MALTRKLMKGLGLTDEQIDTIIEAHAETVDGLKSERDQFKASHEALPGIQKELDDLKAAGANDGGYKEKYEKEHADFEAYKADIAGKETKAAKEKAVRAYFESKNITGKNLEIAMRGVKAEMEGVELEGDAIKDASSLDALVAGDFAGLVGVPFTKGAPVPTPPTGDPAGKDAFLEGFDG